MIKPNTNRARAGRQKKPAKVVLSGCAKATGDTSAAAVPTILAVDVPSAAKVLGIRERLCWDLVGSRELVSFMARGRRLVAIAEIEAYIRRQQDAERTRAA